ncbi:rhamnogalacturonan acetylesterase [Streptomyces sp. JH34]|uniref:rhamnogalacturonan acetylesterase n=1 Tax=unclassified Streptomyces TaxID=2593676 RepID=UPI0023F7E733|nr:rhamnogalacturonan acetylesterase [Streptomyces sp. JH34]MDF6022728.1 rhamnogalacturonan acetylesterase [Streptomyces sp. JH34]
MLGTSGKQHTRTVVPTSPTTVCHFEVDPGTYDVEIRIGGDAAGSTRVSGGARRSLLPETVTAAGERVTLSFTMNVRVPEGEPTRPVEGLTRPDAAAIGPDSGSPGAGSPGLNLLIGGSDPAPAEIRVTRAGETLQLFLVGDSTVCDQAHVPYTGWGQQLTQYFRRGLSVANYASSGESTVSYLEDPRLFATVLGLMHEGDLVLVQLAHNDRTTDGATYRCNLEALVDGVRGGGGRPVLLTPMVRHAFGPDGTLGNDSALLVNALGVDHPAVIRSVAASRGVPLIDLTAASRAVVESSGAERSRALYLCDEEQDHTHTSEHGAGVYADLVRAELLSQGLVPRHLFR